MASPKALRRCSIANDILDKTLRDSWQPMLLADDLAEPKLGRRSWNLTVLTHVTLVCVYTICSILAIWSMKPSEDPAASAKQHFALADITARQNEIRQYNLMSDSKFVGHPSNGSSDAWDNLLRVAHVRVTPVELFQSEPPTLRSDNRTSVALPSGGLLAWLGVMHELHCIKVLYEANYREHFWPEIDEKRRRELQVHADHCVDQLRQVVMCRADLGSLTTFTWRQGYEKPLLSPERPLHQCVDWDHFLAQVSHRVVSAEEMTLLQSLRGGVKTDSSL